MLQRYFSKLSLEALIIFEKVSNNQCVTYPDSAYGRRTETSKKSDLCALKISELVGEQKLDLKSRRVNFV